MDDNKLKASCKTSIISPISNENHHKHKSEILYCSQMVGYNNAVAVMRYKIQTIVNSKLIVLYTSPSLSEWQTMKVNLDTLNIAPGTPLYVTAIPNVRHSEDLLETIIYTPNSNTIYFEYIHTDNPPYYYPVYNGMVKSPLSPPVLKCSYLYVLCDAGVNTRYELRLASTNERLFETGITYDRDDTWLFALSDLSLVPGTKLKLHAGVIAGKDSEPYVILQYDPNLPETEDMAQFTLIGNGFYTSMLFEGLF